MEFKRGQHEQIFPPPLVEGIRPEDILDVLPDREALVSVFGVDAARSLAVAVVSRRRMVALLDGAIQPSTDTEQALVDAVNDGAMVSLLLIGQEVFDGAGLAPRISREGASWCVVVGDRREFFNSAREGVRWWAKQSDA